MKRKTLIIYSAFIISIVLITGVSSANLRSLLWDDPYCNTFSADGSYCLKCSYHYYMDKYYKCQPVSDWCKTWNDATGACTSCFPGYPDPVNGVCLTTPVVGGGTDDDHCSQYGYVDSYGSWYTSQWSNCKKVCKVCDSGYYLDSCYKCILLPTYCTAADVYGNCTACVTGYHVDTGACVIDVVGNPGCDHCLQYGYQDSVKAWYASYFKGCKKVCKVCESGYYLDCNNNCIALPGNCLAADQYGNCTDCADGYHVQNGVCVVDDDHCCSYGYVDYAKKWYTQWSNGCQKVCKVCDPGYYLNCNYTCVALPGNCLAADQYGNCTDCADGYHVQNGVCVVDDDHCCTYGYVDYAKKWYTQWSSSCKKVCKVCDSGYYLNCNYTCIALPAYCEAADENGQCTDCVDGYHVQNGTCVVDDDHCCTYGYVDYANKWYTQWSNGCKKVCKVCDPGYYLNCNHTCIALPANCQAADQNGECTSCVDGYHVQNGTCVVDDDHCCQYGYVDASKKWYTSWASGCQKVCTKCDPGFYLDQNNECQQLPDHCIQADCNGKCTKCCTGYTVSSGVCVVVKAAYSNKQKGSSWK